MCRHGTVFPNDNFAVGPPCLLDDAFDGFLQSLLRLFGRAIASSDFMGRFPSVREWYVQYPVIEADVQYFDASHAIVAGNLMRLEAGIVEAETTNPISGK